MGKFLKLALVLPFLLAPLYGAVLAGDTINVTHYFPSLLSADSDMGTQTAPGTFFYAGILDVTVNDATILVTAHCGDGCTWTGTDFNGPLITDLSRSPITSVLIDASSTYVGFDTSRLAFDGSHVYINLQGLDANGFLQLDLASVPEPGTAGLLGLALIAFSVAVRRRFSR